MKQIFTLEKKTTFFVLAITVATYNCNKEQDEPLNTSTSSNTLTKGGGSNFTPFKPTTYTYVIRYGDTIRIFERQNMDSLLKWSHPASLYTRKQCADSSALIARRLADTLISSTRAAFAAGRFLPRTILGNNGNGYYILAVSNGLGTAAQTPGGHGTVLHPGAPGTVYIYHYTVQHDPTWPGVNYQIDVYWNMGSNGLPTEGMVTTGVWGYGQYLYYAPTTLPPPVLTYTQTSSDGIRFAWDAQGTEVTGGNWGIMGFTGSFGNFTDVTPMEFRGVMDYVTDLGQDGSIIYVNSKYGSRMKMQETNGLR